MEPGIKAFEFPTAKGLQHCLVDTCSSVPVEQQLPEEVREFVWIPGGFDEDDLLESTNSPDYDGESLPWTVLQKKALYVHPAGSMIIQIGDLVDDAEFPIFRILWKPNKGRGNLRAQDIYPLSYEEAVRIRDCLRKGDIHSSWETEPMFRPDYDDLLQMVEEVGE